MPEVEAMLEDCDCGSSKLAQAVGVIDGKWKIRIVCHLFGGTKRFNELRRLLGMTHRVLALELRQLESDGIVERKLYASVPPKVEYSLTARGRTLRPVLAALSKWGRESASADT